VTSGGNANLVVAGPVVTDAVPDEVWVMLEPEEEPEALEGVAFGGEVTVAVGVTGAGVAGIGGSEMPPVLEDAWEACEA